MDWLPSSDPFIAPNNLDLFDYESKCRDPNQICKVIQNWDPNKGGNSKIIQLPKNEDWKRWIESLQFVEITENDKVVFIADKLPEDGFSILCIPPAEDIILNSGPEPSTFTDLPLDGPTSRSWEKIAEAFHLPGHFPKLAARKQTSVTFMGRSIKSSGTTKKLWMHTAIANPYFEEDAFAVASSHFEGRHLTLAVMFGCSECQIDRINGLLNACGEFLGHPLLMMGIYAELQLDRLVSLVNATQRNYDILMDGIDNDINRGKRDCFTWKTIREVRLIREESMKVEEEITATKLRLATACSSALETLKESGCPDYESETTRRFRERSNDITTRLEDQVTRCRIVIENISFATDIIRSELSRQETQISSGISLIAMVYLPLTTMATIFAMPIFQWSNDWRDWRYHPVDSGNTSDSNSQDASDGELPPVVSGYIWIYLSISVSLTIITYFSFRRYMSHRGNKTEDNSERRFFSTRSFASSSFLSSIQEARNKFSQLMNGDGEKETYRREGSLPR
ncbi:hypothetical protein F5Y04DRAFT_240201 [Hypomontagnella monticulosa]|nr:hypothetical protein F5Y04DRAFT_240201 [Hypomontagnella monticulosa]